MEEITHVLKTEHRTLTLKVREKEKLIEVDFLVDNYDHAEDAERDAKWMIGCLKKYDNDPRPLSILHPDSGERCIMTGPGKTNCTLVIPIDPEKL